jgi:hypothetical protein
LLLRSSPIESLAQARFFCFVFWKASTIGRAKHCATFVDFCCCRRSFVATGTYTKERLFLRGVLEREPLADLARGTPGDIQLDTRSAQ